MAKFLRLVNGYPTTIETADEAYSGSIYYSSGLAANTTITLPSSGSFLNASAKDIIIIHNDRVLEFSTDGVVRDFIVIGAGPTYTQIQIIYALPNDSVLVFKKVL